MDSKKNEHPQDCKCDFCVKAKPKRFSKKGWSSFVSLPNWLKKSKSPPKSVSPCRHPDETESCCKNECSLLSSFTTVPLPSASKSNAAPQNKRLRFQMDEIWKADRIPNTETDSQHDDRERYETDPLVTSVLTPRASNKPEEELWYDCQDQQQYNNPNAPGPSGLQLKKNYPK